MKKTLCFLLLCLILSCKKSLNNKQAQLPHFYFKKSKDSLQFYLEEIKNVNASNFSDSLKAEYAFMTGRLNHKLQNYDDAIKNFNKACSYTTRKITNARETLYFRALFSMYFRIKNDNLNAAGVNEKFYNLLDSTDYKNKAYYYSNNHNILKAVERVDEALKMNLISADLFLKSNDTLNYLIATIDNAAMYSKQQKPIETNKELDKVIPYKNLLQTPSKYQFHGARGNAYYQNKQYKKAVEAYKKAIYFSKKLPKATGKGEIINSYLNLSTTYLKMNTLDYAEKYIDSIFAYGLKNIRSPDKKEILKNALEINYRQKKGVQKIMLQLDSLITYVEESYNHQINNELHVLKESFENEKKLQQEKNQAEITSLTLERNQYILLLLLLSVLVISVLMFNFYRQRKFSMEKQNFLLQQRLLRSQMNPHFIFNSLSLIKQGVNTNKDQSTKYIVKLSRLLRTIFDNSTQDFVPLEDELTSLQDYIELQQFRFPDKFTYKINNHVNMDTELAIPPMLLQPFVENAIIHGFRGLYSKGYLEITLTKERDFLVCKIEDNGIGYKKKSDKKQSSISLINKFLLKMTGENILILNKSEISDSYGTIIEVKIPYSE